MRASTYRMTTGNSQNYVFGTPQKPLDKTVDYYSCTNAKKNSSNHNHNFNSLITTHFITLREIISHKQICNCISFPSHSNILYWQLFNEEYKVII